jgi:hypothetical protein
VVGAVEDVFVDPEAELGGKGEDVPLREFVVGHWSWCWLEVVVGLGMLMGNAWTQTNGLFYISSYLLRYSMRSARCTYNDVS